MEYAKELAASRKSPVIGIFDYNDTIHFCDIDSNKIINSIKTKEHACGLIISNDGRFCFTSAYYRYGISCLSIDNGKRIWKRKDLVKDQFTYLSIDGSKLYCGFDKRIFTVLNAKTGETIDTIRGTDEIYESPYDSIFFIVKKDKYLITDKNLESEITIAKESFALLDIAFGPGVICITESGKDTRFIDIQSGNEIWRYVTQFGHHVLDLMYCENGDCFYGVEWHYQTGSEMMLVMLDPNKENNRVISEIRTNPNAICFTSTINVLVTSFGEIIELDTGKSKGKIPIFD